MIAVTQAELWAVVFKVEAFHSGLESRWNNLWAGAKTNENEMERNRDRIQENKNASKTTYLYLTICPPSIILDVLL